MEQREPGHHRALGQVNIDSLQVYLDEMKGTYQQRDGAEADGRRLSGPCLLKEEGGCPEMPQDISRGTSRGRSDATRGGARRKGAMAGRAVRGGRVTLRI